MAEINPAKAISESLDQTGEGLGYNSNRNAKLGKETITGVQKAINKFLEKEKVSPLLEPDGGYGELTKAAVVKFQEKYKDKYGLVSHGAIDRKTLRALIGEGFLEGFEKKEKTAITPNPEGRKQATDTETPGTAPSLPEITPAVAAVINAPLENLPPPPGSQLAQVPAPPAPPSRSFGATAQPGENPSAELLTAMKVDVERPQTVDQRAGEKSGFKVTVHSTGIQYNIGNPTDPSKGYVSDVKVSELKPSDGGFQSTIKSYNKEGGVLDEIQLSFNSQGKLVTMSTLHSSGEKLGKPEVQKFVTASNGKVLPEPTAEKMEMPNGTNELGKSPAKYGLRLSTPGHPVLELPLGNPPQNNKYGLGPIAEIKTTPLTPTSGGLYKLDFTSLDANGKVIDKGSYIFDKDYKLLGGTSTLSDGEAKTSFAVSGYESTSEVVKSLGVTKHTPLDEKSELLSKLNPALQAKFKSLFAQGIKVDMYHANVNGVDQIALIYSKDGYAIWSGQGIAKPIPEELNSRIIVNEEVILHRSKDLQDKQKVLSQLLPT